MSGETESNALPAKKGGAADLAAAETKTENSILHTGKSATSAKVQRKNKNGFRCRKLNLQYLFDGASDCKTTAWFLVGVGLGHALIRFADQNDTFLMTYGRFPRH